LFDGIHLPDVVGQFGPVVVEHGFSSGRRLGLSEPAKPTL
jgi:hypothetical protein